MKAKVEKLGECKVALRIEVPADRVTEELNSSYQDLQKQAKSNLSAVETSCWDVFFGYLSS